MMRFAKTKLSAAAVIFALVLALAGGGIFAIAINALAADNVTTATETVVTSDGLVRAVKAENDSFTVSYQNDCTDVTNWGFAFANSPDIPFGIGDGSATADALDILIQAENFNVYQNNGWSECTSVLQENQGAGWMLAPYSVNKPTHLTVSKAADGGVRIACYSEGGNVWAKQGVDLGLSAWKNGKTLRFDDLTDENGYVYWRVAPSNDYPITVSDNRTTVSDITFENVRDISAVRITGAKSADGKNLYVAAALITESGYSFVCEDAAKLVFTDGENTVTADVGANVVFPKSNYALNGNYKLGYTAVASTDDRFSVGDSKYGMIEVTEEGVRFNVGIELPALPSGNKNFNICIGPNTAVQAAGQNMGEELKNTFSLFATVTGEGKLALSFYDYAWRQFTGDIEFVGLSVGELNVVPVEIKKENGEFFIYVAERKLEGSNGNNTLDFNGQIGSGFINADGKTNIAFVGHNGLEATLSLLGTKIEVDATVTCATAKAHIAGAKAQDENGKSVTVFDASVTQSGYSFVSLRAADIVKTEFATYGGVTCEVDTKVAERVFADALAFGAGNTLTVSANEEIAAADVKVHDESGNDITEYLDITDNGGKVVVAGLSNKTFDITVAKENMVEVKINVAVANENVERVAELVRATYSVTLDIRCGNVALENMENNIKVYAADSADGEPLNVNVTFVDSKYVVSGIAAGSAVRIEFAAEGYTQDGVSTAVSGEFTMVVNRIYTAEFTVKAGDGYITDASAIEVRGANVTAVYDGSKFVLADLTSEVRVTVRVDGYEDAVRVFDYENAYADIVLVKSSALDKSALQAAINAAKTELGKVKVSADGSDVSATEKWVTAEVKTALERAVTAAESAMSQADTQQLIDDAKTALNSAVSDFTGAAKNGTFDSDEDAGCGCSGSVATSFGAGALLAVLAAAAMLIKRKRTI